MKNEQTKQKFPIGLVLILVLTGFNAMGLLTSLLFPLLFPSAFQIPIYHLGPILLNGAEAVFVHLITLGILAAIFFGLIRRLEWARRLTLVWCIFSIISITVNMALSFLADATIYKDLPRPLPSEVSVFTTPAAINSILIIGMFISWGTNIAIITYLRKKKDFFTK